eukprot:c34725_g1_i1 orf=339-491(-)
MTKELTYKNSKLQRFQSLEYKSHHANENSTPLALKEGKQSGIYDFMQSSI